jgi:hypothetical protein
VCLPTLVDTLFEPIRAVLLASIAAGDVLLIHDVLADSRTAEDFTTSNREVAKGGEGRVPLPAFVNTPFGCCDGVTATMHWMLSDAGASRQLCRRSGAR